jgi:hypothetical protein
MGTRKRTLFGIMWMSNLTHIMVDMGAIEAQCPWSWRLTITLHIKQMSEFPEQRSRG